MLVCYVLCFCLGRFCLLCVVAIVRVNCLFVVWAVFACVCLFFLCVWCRFLCFCESDCYYVFLFLFGLMFVCVSVFAVMVLGDCLR